MRKTIDAVGYARRSTDMQERSIPDQKAYVEKWAKENGYRILRWYADDAISGTSVRDRDQFETMIADAEDAGRSGGGRDFDAVLCYDLSRFSRGGTNETGYYIHRLHMAGVESIFPAEGIPDGDEGELLQGVKSWQNRQFSVKLSRDTLRGMVSSVTQGRNTPGGCNPYGYDRQHVTADGTVLRTIRQLPDGRRQEFDAQGNPTRILSAGDRARKDKSIFARLVPSSPERVAVVRRIFDQYINGYGITTIAYELNQEQVPAVFSRHWTVSSIKGILSNPVYRGAIVWNQSSTGKIHGVDGTGNTKRKRSRNREKNERGDWYVIEDAHEPLVSREVFEQAQKIRRQRAGERTGGAARVANRSLLSGLFTCRHCGNGYHHIADSSTYKGRKRTYRYYRCTGFSTGGTGVCPCSSIPAGQLEAVVLDRIRRILLGDHHDTDAAIDDFVAAVLGGKGQVPDTAEMKKAVAAVTRRIEATVDMLADPDFEGLDELRATLVKLKARRDDLQADLEQIERTGPAAPNELDLRDWAGTHIAALDGDIDTYQPSPVLRQLVQQFVNRIEIDPHAKRGAIHLPKDLASAYQHVFVGNAAHGNASPVQTEFV
ncbi:MAG: recombinase family protein [Phycisphaeraceae bacterium]